jgi:hypothetical protein
VISPREANYKTNEGWRAVAALAVVAGLAACGSGNRSGVVLAQWNADAPVSPIAGPTTSGNATAYFAERLSGRIYRISLNDFPDKKELIATVDVDSSGEQRGLLGLAFVGERLFASWVRPGDLRLVVGPIDKGRAEATTWVGPVTNVKAIGGHLDVLEGRLVIGFGELVTDPTLAGRVVTIAPDGPADQTPVEVSAGWHNPFGFIVDAGKVVVADNAPDGQRERLGTSEFPEVKQRAPSAIVRVDAERFGVCGFLDGEMRAYRIAGTTVERSGTIMSSGCRTGAVALDGQRYLVTDERVVTLFGPTK